MNRLFASANRYIKPLLALNLLLLAGLAYAIYTRPTRWQAQAELILPFRSTTSEVNSGNLDYLDQRQGTELEVAPQPKLLDKLPSLLLSDENLTELWKQDHERDRFETVEDYSKLFSLSQRDGAAILSLEVGADAPEVAQARLKRMMDLLGDRLTQLRQGEATEQGTVTSEAEIIAEAELRSTQEQVTAFQIASGLVKSKAETHPLVKTLSQLKSRYTDVTSAQLASQTEVEVFQARLDLTPDEAAQSLALVDDETYQFLRQQIVRLDADIAGMRSIYQDDHPEVLLLQSKRAQLQQQAEARRTNIAGATAPDVETGPQYRALMEQLLLAETTAQSHAKEAQALQKQIVLLEQQVKALPQKQEQLAELQGDHEAAKRVHNGLVAKRAQSRLNAVKADSGIQILSQSTVLSQPIGPKSMLMILGALFAAGFSITALALLVQDSRRPLSSSAKVFTSDLRVLGTVPQLSKPVQQFQGREPLEQAFKRLAAGITALRLKRRRILFSSAASGEGKTTTIIGLGRALTALGFRVLVVDGDFYRAGLSQRFRPPSRVRSNTAEIFGLPVAIAPNLDLMPTVPGQPRRAMEFVARGDFETTLALAEQAGKYDYLLVDSAPMGLTSEAPIMGAATENVLLVTRAGFSKREQVHRALDEFSRHRVNLLGLLVNATPQTRKPKASRVYRQKSWSGVG